MSGDALGPEYAEFTRSDASDLAADYTAVSVTRDGPEHVLGLNRRGEWLRRARRARDCGARARWSPGERRLPVVSSGGWVDEDTFRAEVIAIESPHRFRVEARLRSSDADLTWRMVPLTGSRPAVARDALVGRLTGLAARLLAERPMTAVGGRVDNRGCCARQREGSHHGRRRAHHRRDRAGRAGERRAARARPAPRRGAGGAQPVAGPLGDGHRLLHDPRRLDDRVGRDTRDPAGAAHRRQQRHLGDQRLPARLCHAPAHHRAAR